MLEQTLFDKDNLGQGPSGGDINIFMDLLNPQTQDAISANFLKDSGSIDITQNFKPKTTASDAVSNFLAKNSSGNIISSIQMQCIFSFPYKS